MLLGAYNWINILVLTFGTTSQFIYLLKTVVDANTKIFPYFEPFRSRDLLWPLSLYKSLYRLSFN